MKGDVIIVEAHHRAAASLIVDHLMPRISESAAPYCISVAGESGSGKSETAQAIHEALGERSVPSYIFQQDDYFVLPPRSNDARRREDIDWVGIGEVHIEKLNEHLGLARSGGAITKPLVDYEADAIGSEEVALSGTRVFIAEGTYTSLLANVDTRIFINRNRLDTLESRKKRGREAIEPFLERVLEIEHRIISAHLARADIVIGRDYDVKFPS